jgi:enoyl-CoA hydratase/carnithine racemase
LLSVRALAALHAAIDEISRDQTIRALIFEGGKAGFFSAGADINELADLDGGLSLEFARLGQSLFARLEALPKLVIGAVDGYCMGGGLDFLLACDIRIATPGSVFAHPGAGMGIITGFGGTARLPREVGRGRARELFWSGRRIGAEEALEIGLINEIVPRGSLRSRCLETSRKAADRADVLLKAFKTFTARNLY